LTGLNEFTIVRHFPVSEGLFLRVDDEISEPIPVDLLELLYRLKNLLKFE